MSSRGKRGKKSEEESKSFTITQFLEPQQPQQPKAKEEPRQAPFTSQVEQGLGGIEEEVYSYIKSRGHVSRRELEGWGKARGLTSAQLYGAIYRLAKLGKITRRIIDDELSYIAV